MSSTGYSVTTDALFKDANEWDGEGQALASINSEVRTLSMGGISAGIFIPATSEVDGLVEVIGVRAMQGSDEMQNIAKALRMTAQSYEAHESATAQAFRMLHI